MYLERKSINAPVAHLKGQVLPVLLEMGTGDEAVRYIAHARAVSHAGEYLVYVLENSMILDLVRMKRFAPCTASFGHDDSYEASLALARIPFFNDQVALALSLVRPLHTNQNTLERMVPLT